MKVIEEKNCREEEARKKAKEKEDISIMAWYTKKIPQKESTKILK